MVARQDYLPFGEEIPADTAGRSASLLFGASDDVEQKFTGQIRDSETGMDFFTARYYGSALGRFISPDPANAGADATDPQSWNAYAYVRNNPLALVDPSGMDSIDCSQAPPGDQACRPPNPATNYLDYSMYVNQRMWYSQNDPVLGWDPFSVMLVGSTFSSSGGASGGSQQSATITYSSGGFEKVNFDPILNISPVSMSVAMAMAAQAMQTTSGPAIPPRKSGNSQPLQPTRFRIPIPFWHNPLPKYCGPGTGSGAPVNQVDAACQAHDQCYQNAGVTGADIFNPARGPTKTAAIKACDAQLCKRLTTIVPENRTENGDAFFVGLFFSVSHGSASACIP